MNNILSIRKPQAPMERLLHRITRCETFRQLDDHVRRDLDGREPGRHEQVALTCGALRQREADMVTDMPGKGDGGHGQREQYGPMPVGVSRARQQVSARTGIGKRSEVGKAVADDHPGHRHAEEVSRTRTWRSHDARSYRNGLVGHSIWGLLAISSGCRWAAFMERAKPVSTRGASVRATATTLGGGPGAREQRSEILCLSYRVERGQTIEEYFRAGGKRTMRSRTVVHNLVPTALRGQPGRIQHKVRAHAR